MKGITKSFEFWAVLFGLALIGGMAWERPHSFWDGLLTGVFVMAIGWGAAAWQAQIQRHALERKIEDLSNRLDQTEQ